MIEGPAGAPAPPPSPFFEPTSDYSMVWLNEHLKYECRTHVGDSNPTEYENDAPLHFKSTTNILGREYTLDLRKTPRSYFLDDFTVESTHRPPRSSSLPLIVNRGFLPQPGGFYHQDTELLLNAQLECDLLKLRIKRCQSIQPPLPFQSEVYNPNWPLSPYPVLDITLGHSLAWLNAHMDAKIIPKWLNAHMDDKIIPRPQ